KISADFAEDSLVGMADRHRADGITGDGGGLAAGIRVGFRILPAGFWGSQDAISRRIRFPLWRVTFSVTVSKAESWDDRGERRPGLLPVCGSLDRTKRSERHCSIRTLPGRPESR